MKQQSSEYWGVQSSCPFFPLVSAPHCTALLCSAGVVPIYYGAPDIDNFMPPHSFIDGRMLSAPQALLSVVTELHRDPRESSGTSSEAAGGRGSATPAVCAAA